MLTKLSYFDSQVNLVQNNEELYHIEKVIRFLPKFDSRVEYRTFVGLNNLVNSGILTLTLFFRLTAGAFNSIIPQGYGRGIWLINYKIN